MSDFDGSPEDDDYDMASARSLISTANDLVLEYGRRYPNHAYGSQVFPRGDDMAITNERALHNLMLHLCNNKLFMSDIENPENVLDVRCGTDGLWAKNMADSFPDAQITGLDVFPAHTEGQENLQFILQDYNNQWILDEIIQTYRHFDFIYARELFAGSRDFPAFYQQCFENLRSGGYFEQTEISPNMECNDEDFDENKSMVAQVSLLAPILGRVMKTEYSLGGTIKTLLEDAGFVDVVEKKEMTPWSPWKDPLEDPRGHETGRRLQWYYETGVQGWILKPLVDHFDLSREQVDEWVDGAIAELKSNEHGWYSYNVTVTARKPPT